MRVKIRITGKDGSLIEEGEAALEPVFRQSWSYISSRQNPSIPGTIIKTTTDDIPENRGTLEITL